MTPGALEQDLRSALDPARVLTRAIDRLAWANDASVYRLVPRVVVFPSSTDEVAELFRITREHGAPLTFRAAGTSLSGQAVTDGILAVLSRHWRDIEVLDRGRQVRVQPGAIGGVVNARLAPHGAKLGPDPASINACMMGGILANNSSGMCCGIEHNAYHTLESMRFVLPSGLIVESSRADADEQLRRQAPRIWHGLLELKRRVETNEDLERRIRTKYRLKNTMGYSIHALLDFARPVDILTHLLIGSEGTLGFIAEAVLRTIPDHPHKHTGLLFFPDVAGACSSIPALRDSGARALELMDRASLRSVEDQPGVPQATRDLPPEASALLVEYQCADAAELAACKLACDELLRRLRMCADPVFPAETQARAALWRVRKGLIPSVGAMRKRGTSFIIEDVVFPPERLAEGVLELQALFDRHRYEDAIVFGHAKDGNLHFVLTQAFDQAREVERYDRFMHELAELVAVRHGGALKAEHGTGRNMAPFLATEWGADARQLMREIKELVDPAGLLNPDVILNDDPRAHVTHLKELPRVEEQVDACIECGFCERYCPSRDLTMTPRQRIVVRREMARLRENQPRSALLRELERDYSWDALETCAADGLCATGCPVSIDTGSLVKRLRAASHAAASHATASWIAEHFALAERAARSVLRVGALARTLAGGRLLSRAFRRNGSGRWLADLPRAAHALPQTAAADAVAIYFPSCVTRVAESTGGDDDTGLSLPEALVAVAGRAGVAVHIPEARGRCCGMPFSSKGFDGAARLAANRTVAWLWQTSREGSLPVVLDTSPCAYTLKHCRDELDAENRSRFDRLALLDGVEFAARLVPTLAIAKLPDPVALHPVCSLRKQQLTETFERVASACAERAEVPIDATCCGFAGDRGFALPELTAAATRDEAAELGRSDYAGYYSSSRTCEIGMTRACGRPFRSYWHLLERVSRAERAT